MKRNIAETILGAFVIAVAIFFLIFSYRVADLRATDGYEITADFAGTGGLKAGDDVMLSGVKVGHVERVTLVPENYLARVHMGIESGIKLPEDTAALISSESLLGGRYLALEPGADEAIIQPGGHIQYTQAPQNLEQLLGQFIFSMKDEKPGSQGAAQTAPVLPAGDNIVKAPEEAEEKPEMPHDIPEIIAPEEKQDTSQEATPPAEPAANTNDPAEPVHP
jgi:phospholipid/cholesterol/gamma-HCH transport system substrate-binding protein